MYFIDLNKQFHTYINENSVFKSQRDVMFIEKILAYNIVRPPLGSNILFLYRFL